MIERIILLSFLLYTTNGFCQAVNVYTIGFNCVKQNQYLKAIDTLNKLRKEYRKTNNSDLSALSTNNYDHAINLFTSFIGEDYPYKFKNDQPTLKNEKANFTEAIPYIVKAAKDRRVVMLNENHYLPKHRLLTYNLLEAFYKLGYRYLALETLIPDMPIELSHGKPLPPYANEPNMANLIREAQRLGFKLIAYESEDNTPDNPDFPNHRLNMRELNQARNLYQVIVKDSTAKILVHAGISHIWERASTDRGMHMAEYFKVISGIDPLTINQSVLIEDEFTKRLGESPDLKSNATPYVVLDSLRSPKISVKDRVGDYDLLVAWPLAQVISGRKDFMLAKTGTKQLMISVKEKDTSNLMQVLSYGDDGGIPIDQFKVKQGQKEVATSLQSGKYLIRLVDLEGVVLWKRAVTVL